MRLFFRWVLVPLLSWPALVLYNLLTLALISMAAIELDQLWVKPGNDHKEMLDVLSGIGVVLIGYGVLMEERGTIFEVLKLYPELSTARSLALDKLCHAYGLGYLVLGLLLEVAMETIRLPNNVLDTAGREAPIYAIGIAIIGINILLLARHIFKLVQASSLDAEKIQVIDAGH